MTNRKREDKEHRDVSKTRNLLVASVTFRTLPLALRLRSCYMADSQKLPQREAGVFKKIVVSAAMNCYFDTYMQNELGFMRFAVA